VDFVFDRNEVRGLEQNPKTKSRWGEMARSGAKVMQFLSEGRYVANVPWREGDTVRQARGSEPLNRKSVLHETAPKQHQNLVR
jgi:hypothetical protein